MSRKNSRFWVRCGSPLGAAALLILAWLWGSAESTVLAAKKVQPGLSFKTSQASSASLFSRRVFINEIHYDNSGADAGEGVEIAGPAGTDLLDWRLILYNGNGGSLYAIVLLNGLIPDLGYGYGCVFFPIEGLQNGSPDGLALVNAGGSVVQYISYEGVLTAADGPGRGFLGADIFVQENGSEPLGYSLQLRGTGDDYDDFAWSGPSLSTYGDFNIEQSFLPSEEDAALQAAVSAPAYVAPGDRITYTLAVQNLLGYPLHSLVITDRIPAGALFVYALDGGQEVNGLVTWAASSLSSGSGLELRFVVQAPLSLGTIVADEHYGASALEWATPATGEREYTTVGDTTPATAIQGNGKLSLWRGKPVKTRGVVNGLFQGNTPDGHSFNGFFLQDIPGDGDPQTSDGLFVNIGSGSIPVELGDLVEAGGVVQEFDEFEGPACPGEACLTQVAVSGSASLSVIGSGSVSPVILDPPGDVDRAAAYFEAREAMLVTLPLTATVTGPTSFGTLSVLPGDEGLERVLHGWPQEGMTFGVRHWERSGDIDGRNAPGLITGSVVDHFRGPLAWSYGDYLVVTQPGDPWTVVTSRPAPVGAPSWPAPGPSQFSVATLNTDKLDGWGIQFTKVISTIVQMNGPTFLALQEVNPSSVFPSLITRLGARGYHYNYAISHADVSGYGVGLLWRTGKVQDISWSSGYQDCSPNGSPSSTHDPLWETCRSRGEYPLFARRPVVVSGTLELAGNRLPVVVISNHFKSRLEGESSEQRRLEEASFVGKLAGDLAAHGSTGVIVMGDLNDFEGSLPLQALLAGGGLVNTWTRVYGQDHYSFIYQGVSQVLDHILVSPDLLPWLELVAPLHFNADFPYSPYASSSRVLWRSSDHDPVAAMFTVRPGNRIYLSIITGVK